MKIRIIDIVNGQVQFVLIEDDGSESNELHVSTAYFEDVRKMAALNLNCDSAQNASELNIMEKHRLKRLGAQLTASAG